MKKMNALTENIVWIWLLPVILEIILPLGMLLFYLLGKSVFGVMGGEARETGQLPGGNGQATEIRPEAL